MPRAVSVKLLAAAVLPNYKPWRRDGSGAGRGLSIGDRLLTCCRRNRWIGRLPRVRPARRSSLVMWWIGLIVTRVALAACDSSDLGPIALVRSR